LRLSVMACSTLSIFALIVDFPIVGGRPMSHTKYDD
jgi:hypothetical protein